MRRVQHGTPITDFGGRKQISFDALFSSDSEEETSSPVVASPDLASGKSVLEVQPANVSRSNVVVASPPSPDFPYSKEDDPISVWTQKVTESFEKASQSKKQLPPDFKESLGRLSFFRKAPLQQSVSKEQTSTTTVNAK
jgi:hypothetical protein